MVSSILLRLLFGEREWLARMFGAPEGELLFAEDFLQGLILALVELLEGVVIDFLGGIGAHSVAVVIVRVAGAVGAHARFTFGAGAWFTLRFGVVLRVLRAGSGVVLTLLRTGFRPAVHFAGVALLAFVVHSHMAVFAGGGEVLATVADVFFVEFDEFLGLAVGEVELFGHLLNPHPGFLLDGERFAVVVLLLDCLRVAGLCSRGQRDHESRGDNHQLFHKCLHFATRKDKHRAKENTYNYSSMNFLPLPQAWPTTSPRPR